MLTSPSNQRTENKENDNIDDRLCSPAACKLTVSVSNVTNTTLKGCENYETLNRYIRCLTDAVPSPIRPRR